MVECPLCGNFIRPGDWVVRVHQMVSIVGTNKINLTGTNEILIAHHTCPQPPPEKEVVCPKMSDMNPQGRT